MLIVSLLSLSTALAGSWPPAATIEDAAAVQLTPEGLDAVTALLPALLPPSIPIDDIYDDGWFCPDLLLENAEVTLQIAGATITPGAGVLNLEVDLLVSLNSESNPFHVEAICLLDCDAWVDPFPMKVATTIALEVVTGDTGAPVLDATVGEIALSYENADEAINMDCWVGDVEDFLNIFGVSMFEWILGLAEDPLKDAIADLGPEIEAQIEEAFSAATIEQELDLNGVALLLRLFPNDVIITPDGVEVLLSGAVSADAAACAAAYDPGGSLRTDSTVPGIAELAAGTHAGLLLSDDFTNQLLYTAWRGGLLCYELSGDEPLPINTSLLTLLTGDVYADLFAETSDMIIATRPRQTPTAVFSGAHDLGVAVTDLGLNFYAQVDDRMALVVGMGLDVNAGVDLAFNGGTGDLAIEVALGADDIVPHVVANELVAGTDAQVEASFSGAIGGLLDTLLGSLLQDLSFAVPGMSGVGLTGLEVQAAGSSQDWLGAYATVGEVPYATGTDCSSGCGGESSDCGGGCAALGGAPVGWIVPGAVLVLLRRRARS